MGDRTFTEGEAYALVDDGVKRETAARDTRISELESENLTLKNTNDVLVTEKASETQRADQAAQALIDYKESIEQEKARESLRGTRLAAVKEATDLLEITDERAGRIVAMSDEAFTSYVADLREVSAKQPKPKLDKDGKPIPAEPEDDKTKAAEKAAVTGVPRESAAFGSTTESKTTGTVKGVIGAQRALRAG